LDALPKPMSQEDKPYFEVATFEERALKKAQFKAARALMTIVYSNVLTFNALAVATASSLIPVTIPQPSVGASCAAELQPGSLLAQESPHRGDPLGAGEVEEKANRDSHVVVEQVDEEQPSYSDHDSDDGLAPSGSSSSSFLSSGDNTFCSSPKVPQNNLEPISYGFTEPGIGEPVVGKAENIARANLWMETLPLLPTGELNPETQHYDDFIKAWWELVWFPSFQSYDRRRRSTL
jgi:hypothetical protein